MKIPQENLLEALEEINSKRRSEKKMQFRILKDENGLHLDLTPGTGAGKICSKTASDREVFEWGKILTTMIEVEKSKLFDKSIELNRKINQNLVSLKIFG